MNKKIKKYLSITNFRKENNITAINEDGEMPFSCKHELITFYNYLFSAAYHAPLLRKYTKLDVKERDFYFNAFIINQNGTLDIVCYNPDADEEDRLTGCEGIGICDINNREFISEVANQFVGDRYVNYILAYEDKHGKYRLLTADEM